MRIKKFFQLMVILGFVGMMVSVIPVSYGTSLGGALEPNSVKSRIYGFGGHIHYTLEVEAGGLVSIYILDIKDTLEFIRTHNLGNLTPVLSIESTSDIEGNVPIAVPGLYSIIAINPSNETITFELLISRLYPQVGILVPGGMTAFLGVAGLLIQKLKIMLVTGKQ